MTQNATCVPRVVGYDVGKSTITVFDAATGRTTDPPTPLKPFWTCFGKVERLS